MTVSKVDQIKRLVTEKPGSYSAVHGTSIDFIEKLLSKGGVHQGGNFENYFYVLVPTEEKGIDVIESATYYASINAIKDLLFAQNDNFYKKVTKEIDQYLFLTGLGQFASDPGNEKIIGFEVFSPKDFDYMRMVIQKAKDEDRRGVIVYFNDLFLKNFEVVQTENFGQAKVLLSKPITVDDLACIQPLGDYEKTFLNKPISKRT